MAKVQPIRPGATEHEIEIHPYAAAYRMHSAEEFEVLCDRIARNGLRDAITLDRDGRVIDGRNRLKACLKLGIEPRFETFDGDDEAIAEFVSDRNEANKSLTTGQKAMGYAITHPPQRGGRGKKITDNSYSSVRVSEARLVQQYAPDLVEQVVAGSRPLKSAVEEAQRRRADRENVDSRMAALEAQAPDLAALVASGALSLSDALGAAQAREEEKLQKARLRTKMLHDTLSKIFAFDGDFAASIDRTYWPEPDVALASFARTDFERAIATLQQTRDALFQGE